MQGPRRYRLLSPPRVPSSTLVARGVLRGSVSLIRRGDAMPIAAAAAALPDAAPRALVSILSHFASATSPATSRARGSRCDTTATLLTNTAARAAAAATRYRTWTHRSFAWLSICQCLECHIRQLHVCIRVVLLKSYLYIIRV